MVHHRDTGSAGGGDAQHQPGDQHGEEVKVEPTGERFRQQLLHESNTLPGGLSPADLLKDMVPLSKLGFPVGDLVGGDSKNDDLKELSHKEAERIAKGDTSALGKDLETVFHEHGPVGVHDYIMRVNAELERSHSSYRVKLDSVDRDRRARDGHIGNCKVMKGGQEQTEVDF